MEKGDMRRQMIRQLKNLSSAKREAIEHAITNHLISSDIWQQAVTIGITMSQGVEWRTEPIIQAAWQEGKTVCVPKCDPKDRHLAFYAIQHFEQLETAHYQLLEPIPEQTEKITKQAMDLLIVPGLLFDRRGYRIGFGGGYYDRFLSDFPRAKLALAADMQLVDKLSVESFDIPVDAVVTENGLLQRKET